MSSALKKLEEIVADLPADAQAEVIDFAEFLREKKRREQVKASEKARVAGLNQGEIWMSDDFNDELPDEFWFGEDFGIIENKNESVD
ncbi:MAG TPA: DUF2281 domain-containing protein [Pyrinomonadaceae bacterium]|nr:DUF2281 domain-containing protein [Pyrinomonadaceae bacterium]